MRVGPNFSLDNFKTSAKRGRANLRHESRHRHLRRASLRLRHCRLRRENLRHHHRRRGSPLRCIHPRHSYGWVLSMTGMAPNRNAKAPNSSGWAQSSCGRGVGEEQGHCLRKSR